MITAQSILDKINEGVDKLPVYRTEDYEFPSLRLLSIEHNNAKERLAMGKNQLKHLASLDA